jgi:hypothetical protein
MSLLGAPYIYDISRLKVNGETIDSWIIEFCYELDEIDRNRINKKYLVMQFTCVAGKQDQLANSWRYLSSGGITLRNW